MSLFYNPAVRVFIILTLAIAVPHAGPLASAQSAPIESTRFSSNLRGVSVARTNSGGYVVWASGTKGTVLRSTDEGKTWTQLRVPEGGDLDFRDIEGFAGNTAYLMSAGAGDKSRIYKTTDSGKTWTLQYSDQRSAFFLDSLACDSRTHCFALSDPVDGKFLILTTADGRHWRELPRDKMPAALPAEGAFAASGTSIALCGNDIYFGTGGPQARIFHSADRGRSWTAVETPMASGNPSSGIFSVVCSGRYVLAVGGDYKNPESSARVATYSSDRGKTWHLSFQPPSGYRSAIAISSATAIAVGPNGEDVSLDYGAHWKSVDSLDLNAVVLTRDGQAWAVGPSGAFKHFQMKVLDMIYRHRQRETDFTD